LAVIKQGHHHYGTRVHHVLARGVFAIGQAYRVALNLQKVAVQQQLATDLGFFKRVHGG
jgi:hypothetical protein